MTYACRTCGNHNVVKNGTKDCGAYRVLQPRERCWPEQKATILKARQERISLRGLQQVFGVQWQTVSHWLVEQVILKPSI